MTSYSLLLHGFSLIGEKIAKNGKKRGFLDKFPKKIKITYAKVDHFCSTYAAANQFELLRS